MKKKILITDPIEKTCIDILTNNNFVVDHKPGLREDEILEIISDYNILIVRSGTKVTSRIIKAAINLEMIARAGAGVDNIDVDTATKHGIIVMNTPGGNTISTAEHTMGLLLALCRNIPSANQDLKSGIWDRKKYLGTELFGKKIGIIGFGKIGKEVALRCKAFGMEVLTYDPIVTQDVAQKYNVKLVSFDELITHSDFISIHVPYNSETKNLINKDILHKCKDGVKIINCARGGIVNEEDLYIALQSGKVSGVALDVFEKEPLPFPNKLIEHPKVVSTPHIGASTKEAQEKVSIQIANQIIEYYTEQVLIGSVNTFPLQFNITEEIKPFVKLSETLGKLYSSLIEKNVMNINLKYFGTLLHEYHELLSSAFLIGFLSKKITGNVNFVNVQVLSEETGIKIKSSLEQEHKNYRYIISSEIETQEKINKISGTIFGKEEIRIVEIDNYKLDFIPGKYMVLIENIDRPGMLATISGIFANNQINIAEVFLGRNNIGKDALIIMNLDSNVSEDVINKIKNTDGINLVKYFKL